MKKFSFRLARVARVRQIQRDQAQAEFMRARAAQQAVEARIADLRAQAAADANGMTVGAVRSPADIRAAAFRASLRARAAEMAMVDLARAGEEALARAEDLTAASRKVDALGKLRERHHEDWALDVRREEALVLDDIATTRAARRPGGDGR